MPPVRMEALLSLLHFSPTISGCFWFWSQPRLVKGFVVSATALVVTQPESCMHELPLSSKLNHCCGAPDYCSLPTPAKNGFRQDESACSDAQIGHTHLKPHLLLTKPRPGATKMWLNLFSLTLFSFWNCSLQSCPVRSWSCSSLFVSRGL